jgi:hypothetical protein
MPYKTGRVEFQGLSAGGVGIVLLKIIGKDDPIPDDGSLYLNPNLVEIDPTENIPEPKYRDDKELCPLCYNVDRISELSFQVGVDFTEEPPVTRKLLLVCGCGYTYNFNNRKVLVRPRIVDI